MKKTWILVALLAAMVLAVPALVNLVSAERSMPSASVAIADSALVDWGSSDSVVARVKKARVSTILLGMRPISDVAEATDGVVRPDKRVRVSTVAEALRARYGDRAVSVSGRTIRVRGLARPADIEDAPYGYDQNRLEFLVRHGFRVVLALPSGITPDGLDWLDDQLLGAAGTTNAKLAMAFGRMPKVPRDLLERHGLSLVLPDLLSIGDADRFARPGSVVRAHVMPVGSTTSVPVSTDRAERAEKERGVRLIVLRGPPDELREPAPLDRTVAIARDINARTDLRIGEPSAMAPVTPGTPARIASILAALVVITCAGVVVIGLRRPWLILAGALASAGVGAVALGEQTLFLKALMLVSAIAGASLAALLAVQGRRATRSYGLGCLAALTSGVVLASLGSRTDFMIGLERFSGVKVLLLLPALVVALMGVFSLRGRIDVPKTLSSLRPLHILGGALLLAILAYYLIRSDNSGIASAPELWLRDRLDALLYVRPRFKEVFLGFPALFLAAAYKGRFRWVLAVVGAIGTASVVDSFAHFHTPLSVSLLRTGYAMVFGLALGALLWSVYRLLRGGRGWRDRRAEVGSR